MPEQKNDTFDPVLSHSYRGIFLLPLWSRRLWYYYCCILLAVSSSVVIKVMVIVSLFAVPLRSMHPGPSWLMHWNSAPHQRLRLCDVIISPCPWTTINRMCYFEPSWSVMTLVVGDFDSRADWSTTRRLHYSRFVFNLLLLVVYYDDCFHLSALPGQGFLT